MPDPSRRGPASGPPPALASRLLAEVPAGLVLALAALAVAGQLAALAGLRPLATPAGCVALVLGALVVAATTTLVLARSRDGGADGVGGGGLVAGLLLLWLLGPLLVDRLALLRWSASGDNLDHAYYAALLSRIGGMDYDTLAYPQVWHLLVAAIAGPDGGGSSAARVLRVLEVDAVAFAVLVCAVSLAAGNAAARMCAAWGRPELARLSSFVAAALAATPTFVADTLGPGFQTTAVASLAGLVVLRACVDAGRLGPVMVCAAGTVVVAHAWQLLLPVPVLALLLVAVGAVRAGGRRRVVLTVGLCGGAVLASVLPVLAQARATGLSATTTVAFSPGLPVVLLPAAVLAAGAALAGLGSGPAGGWAPRPVPGSRRAALVVLAPLAVVLGLLVTTGASPLAYYPTKLSTHTALLGVPLVAFLVVVGGTALLAHPVLRWLPRLGLAALVVVTLALPPTFLALARLDLDPLLGALRAPGAERASAAWMADRTTSSAVRMLQRIADPAPGRPYPEDQTLSQECADLAASTDPTVVTVWPVGETRERYACVPDLRVVELPGR